MKNGNNLALEVILHRVEAWAGSRSAAEQWYRETPIPSLGSLTAQQLVDKGRVAEVLRYLERIEQGGYA
ncbi:antitoxin Xre/MbcA/ParS toxin-binding domain-containing protein [Halomonas rhizosphaerae]|uniref:antitoxin Xre/MbcA/ParS toxin-binding domain-containing protein n=1 Tax=Halomonas rhizosphaerae TaxID=3043296 RepID=UPI0038996005